MLCRVTKESDINKILENNREMITMVIYSFHDKKLKIFLKHVMMLNFPTCNFILAMMDSPNEKEKKYNFLPEGKFFRYETFPYAVFYYNEENIGNIENANPKIVVETLHNLVLRQNEAIERNKNIEMDEIYKVARDTQIEKLEEDYALHKLSEMQKIIELKEKKNADENETKTKKNTNDNKNPKKKKTRK